MAGEAKRRKRVVPPEKTVMAAAPAPAPKVAVETLTMDDVNAMLASYQSQITRQAGVIATQVMTIARLQRAAKK